MRQGQAAVAHVVLLAKQTPLRLGHESIRQPAQSGEKQFISNNPAS
jgi:hypothetical protein